MKNKTIQFRKNSISALKDKTLHNALINTTNRFREARSKLIEKEQSWDELRSIARDIKAHTIANLDSYLVELEKNVTEAGGTVHWALDAEEACNIIVNIAKENGVKNVVKSKSMATEEIELNKAFIRSGINPVETDLGEYIIQLADEHPSHIIAPAIHKTKKDISKLFSDKFGVSKFEDPQELTKFAREKLRDNFLNADMGVSGANFAVTSTGTIVIVENEGNARLTTTLPKIHVALVGIEKLIPRFEDISLFLNLLVKSATGQKITTYVSLITGPKKTEDPDGPEQFHLVLLDNGRSDILSSEDTIESLYCIRCGACLNICPVYRHVGGHSYGTVYSGPIGSIITPQLEGISKGSELPFASSLCGACKDVCPVKIDFPHVLLTLRNKVVKKKKSINKWLEFITFKCFSIINRNKYFYYLFIRTLYYFQYLLFMNMKKESKTISYIPFIVSEWTKYKDFPIISKKPFRSIWKDLNE